MSEPMTTPDIIERLGVACALHEMEEALGVNCVVSKAVLRAALAELSRLREENGRRGNALRSLQEGAAIALAMVPDEGPVADFLAAIHRTAAQGLLASDDVTNEAALEPPSHD